MPTVLLQILMLVLLREVILIHPLPLAVRLPSISIVPPSKSIDPVPVSIPLSIYTRHDTSISIIA
jgi:hypothetical protein